MFSEFSITRLTNTMFKHTYVDCIFGSESTICVGGALCSRKGTVAAYNCTFFSNKLSMRSQQPHNSDSYGGALGFFDGKLVTKWCRFVDNGLQSLSSSSYGGVIHAYNATMSISNSCFLHNGNVSTGGVLSISHVTCTITSSNFVSNGAVRFGGAMFSEKSSVAIYACEFMYNHNSSTRPLVGGVLIASLEGKISIWDSMFEHNRADFGGVISTEGDIHIDITNSNFSRNHMR